MASSPTAELGPGTTESGPPKGTHASTHYPWGGNDSMWVKSRCCAALFPPLCLWDWDTPDSVLGRWSAIPPDAVPGGQAPDSLRLSLCRLPAQSSRFLSLQRVKLKLQCHIHSVLLNEVDEAGLWRPLRNCSRPFLLLKTSGRSFLAICSPNPWVLN